LAAEVRARVEGRITREILAAASLEQRVATATATLAPAIDRTDVRALVAAGLRRQPAAPWSLPVAELAADIITGGNDWGPGRGHQEAGA